MDNTKRYIAYNGKKMHTILIPKNAARDVLFAAEELSRLLRKATLSHHVIFSNSKMARPTISLGDTELAVQNGIKADSKIVGKQGYQIKTVENVVYIVAASAMGVLNGVYGFLEKVLNYDYFYKGVEHIDRKPVLEVPQLDITDVPDIQERVVANGYQREEYAELRRFRMVDYREVFPDVDTRGAYHNCFGYLPPEVYLKDHPEWYSDNMHTKRAQEGQLCYTARGNKKAYAAMVEEAAKRMYSVLSNVQNNEIVFALNDAWLDWNENCTCSACEAERQKYGSYSGSVIKFLNSVSEKVEQLFRENNDMRAETFKVVFYAYHQLSVPPVRFVLGKDGKRAYDDAGNPIIEYLPEMKFGKHLAIVYAQTWCDLIRGFYNPVHKHYLEDVKAWNQLSQNSLYVWTYDRYFDQCGNFMPYDSFRGMKDLYKFAKENNVSWLYNEACGENGTGTAFTLLKGYLHSKLGWKTDMDIEALEKKFFNAMYGSQSETMYQIYKEIREFSKKQVDELHFPTQLSSRQICYIDYWSQERLYSWLKRMEAVEEALIQTKELEAAKHVQIEQIFPLGMLVRVFRDNFSKQEHEEQVKKLKQYLFDYGFVTLGAGSIGWVPDFFEMIGMSQKEIWG